MLIEKFNVSGIQAIELAESLYLQLDDNALAAKRFDHLSRTQFADRILESFLNKSFRYHHDKKNKPGM